MLAGCDSKDSNSGGPTTKSSSAGDLEPIVVGGSMPRTGPIASWGISSDQGIRLAVEERNAKGGIHGHPIQFVCYDSKGDVNEVGKIYTRLINEDHAVAILGELSSSMSLAGAPVAQKLGVPMISPYSTNTKVTQVGDMIFRVCFIDPFQGTVGASYAYNTLHARTAAVITDTTQAYSTGLSENFITAFKAMGGQIVSEQTYKTGDSDYSAQLGAIREAKPDVIFLPGNYTEVGEIAVQSKKMGITTPYVGGDSWDSPELQKIASDSLEGWTYSNHLSVDDPRPDLQAFITKYQKTYNAKADSLACLGYDAARVLFEAMDKAPSLEGKDLAAAIAKTNDFPGVTGRITLNNDRNADKPAVMLQYQKGVWKFVGSVDPKTTTAPVASR
jgi:branched-chain amino acid transport system substrate-binding protein